VAPGSKNPNPYPNYTPKPYSNNSTHGDYDHGCESITLPSWQQVKWAGRGQRDVKREGEAKAPRSRKPRARPGNGQWRYEGSSKSPAYFPSLQSSLSHQIRNLYECLSHDQQRASSKKWTQKFPRALGLSCGKGTVGNYLREKGCEVVSVDINPNFNPTHAVDILVRE
jgi:hypothetical protein